MSASAPGSLLGVTGSFSNTDQETLAKLKEQVDKLKMKLKTLNQEDHFVQRLSQFSVDSSSSARSLLTAASLEGKLSSLEESSRTLPRLSYFIDVHNRAPGVRRSWISQSSQGSDSSGPSSSLHVREQFLRLRSATKRVRQFEEKVYVKSPVHSGERECRLSEIVVAQGAQVEVHHLPRGGIYVHTSSGALQFGIPPETIKDSMRLGLPVPAFYVVPKERFNLKLGINMCEVEFPAYFNFFLQGTRSNLIVTSDVEKIIRAVVDETLEGPETKHLYMDEEYPEDCPATGRFAFAARPDLQKEIDFFKEPRNGREIRTDTLVNFIVLKEHAGALRADLENGIFVDDLGDEYVVYENGQELVRVPSFLCDWAPSKAALSAPVPLKLVDPPEFGVTVLGSSHGFDPSASTSGFVLWIHKTGIMVDPPPHATDILIESGIMPSMIKGVILTHCHADHDAGTFQKILKEGRITLMTTKTVYESFIRKYSIISGIASGFLVQLFEHRCVKIGEFVHWCGGTLRFFYSLHALPCIGFEAYVDGKSFVYSADTYYDPSGLDKLKERGIISDLRHDALMSFPWHYDVVLHESGIPPIHTPYSVLQELPDKVKENLYTIHITEKAAEDAGLRLAKAGVAHSIDIPVDVNQHCSSASILQLLSSLELFKHFTMDQAADLLHLCQQLDYNSGDYVCRAGDIGDGLYIILSGFCAVELETTDDCRRKVFGAGDHLGEMALLNQAKRSGSIVALTKLSLVKVGIHGFRFLLDTSPDLEHRMRRLSKIRCSESWRALLANSVFARLGSTPTAQLQAIMHFQTLPRGARLWKRRHPVSMAYLVSTGELEFVEMRDELDTPFCAGAFLCNVTSMISQRTVDETCGEVNQRLIEKSKVTLVAKTECQVYCINADDMLEFLDQNPGIFINLIDSLVME